MIQFFKKIKHHLIIWILSLAIFLSICYVLNSSATYVPSEDTKNAQEIQVCKSGCVYDEIQSAVDSITDATTNKRYVVKVSPGIYEENITGKNYVTIKGRGYLEDTIIRGTSGTLYIAPDTYSALEDIRFELNPTADGAKIFNMTAGGDHIIINTSAVITSSTNGVNSKIIEANCDSIFYLRSEIIYTMTGSAAGVENHNIIDIQGTTRFVQDTGNNFVTVGDIDDNVNILVDNTTGQVIYSNYFTTLDITNASYSGDATLANVINDGNLILVLQGFTTITGNGSGNGNVFKVDTTGDNGLIDSNANTYMVSGFTNNYYANIVTGDTINSISDIITADTDSTTGAGVVNFLGTNADGMLQISGGTEFTIDTTNEWHALSNLSTGVNESTIVTAGTTGSITAYADAGGGQVTVTSAGHSLANDDYITITGTTNYNDIYLVANVQVNTFEITETFAGDDATGIFHRGSSIEVLQRGRYTLDWSFSSESAANNVTFRMTAFKNLAEIAGTGRVRLFGTLAAIGVWAGGGNFFLEKGDVIWVGMENQTNATNMTNEEGSLKLVKIS